MSAKIIQDPRSFIKPQTLPIAGQQGLKIQARSEIIYNPCIPSREDVRRQNYMRREYQLSSQGYRSPNHKPYQGIGDPFYLDQKKMILLSLGQWDEDNDMTSSSSSDEDDPYDLPVTITQPDSEITTKFILRRTKTGLHTLDKEVTHGRTLIRNVRLGHDLFSMIRQEKQSKELQEANETATTNQSKLTDLHPAKVYNSDDSDDDDDDVDDIDDNSGDYTETDDVPHHDISDFSSQNSPEHRFSSLASTVTMATQFNSRRKKKVPVLRPFTPKHNNALHKKDPTPCSRQLSALLWLLESMNIDSASVTMSPICQSWILVENEIGGSKVSGKKSHRDKLSETKWEAFTTNVSIRKNSKRPNANRSMKQRRSVMPRMSIQAGGSQYLSVTSLAPGNLSSAQLSSAYPGVPSTNNRLETGSQNESLMSSVQEEESDTPSKGFFKFLDEYYDSLKIKNQMEEEKVESGGEVLVTPAASKPKKHRDKRVRPHTSSSSSQVQYPDEKRVGSFDDEEDGKRTSPSAQTNIHLIRPKSSAELVAFQSNLPSNRHLETLRDLSQSFAKVKQHTALSLHDTLEEMDRNRLKVCETKYRSMPTGCSGAHRALSRLRARSASMMHTPHQEQRQKNNSLSPWFEDLVKCIPSELSSRWYFKVIFSKLQKFASAENASKQTVYRFLSALKTLRAWEICHPDVAASVEFCRERIVEMTVDEYEEWFREVFPGVVRPVILKKASQAGKLAAQQNET